MQQRPLSDDTPRGKLGNSAMLQRLTQAEAAEFPNNFISSQKRHFQNHILK
jgi:hypothetical protein